MLFERDGRKQQETQEVKDERFSHVIVGFDKGEKLRPGTAVAREDEKAKRVRYSEIGDLKQARQGAIRKLRTFTTSGIRLPVRCSRRRL